MSDSEGGGEGGNSIPSRGKSHCKELRPNPPDPLRQQGGYSGGRGGRGEAKHREHHTKDL